MSIPTERVKAKDLRTGDLVVWQEGGDQPVLHAVVTSNAIVPADQRKGWLSKRSGVRAIEVELPNGKRRFLDDGQTTPGAWFDRACSKEAATAQEVSEHVLRLRVGVRTVLSRCETDIAQWVHYHATAPTPENQKVMDSFLDEYKLIFERLEALDRSMTLAAGKTDERKPVNKHGHRRG